MIKISQHYIQAKRRDSNVLRIPILHSKYNDIKTENKKKIYLN